MKAIILARVSTKEQEDGHSLNAQKQRLVEYCQRRGFTVIKTFELIESSTRGERKEFQAMLEFAQRQKETIAIVADAVDRIQRSFKESVQLDELVRKEQIELHFNREGMVIGKKASASDVMRWDFSVMGAKSYVLQLSENVKRSIEYKLKNGEWNTQAPLGYLNTIDYAINKKTLMVDPERQYLVQKVFEEYATGLYSINEMSRRAEKWGLRNKNKAKKPLSTKQIHSMLQNPFYYGEMLFNGLCYPHKYPPLITRELFEHCKAVRLSKNTKANAVVETKQDFIFRSLITCAVSGRKVTSDIKKGKFVYLICRDPENPEKKLFIPESKILEQVESVFQKLKIPESLLKALCDHLNASHDAEKKFHHDASVRLQKEAASIQESQNRLLDLFINGSITKDIYDTKASLLKQEYIEKTMALHDHKAGDDTYKITVSSMVSLVSEAYETFKSSKNHQKRKPIGFLFSNLKLNGANLEYTLRSPFDLMVNPSNYDEWCPQGDSNPCYRRERAVS